MKKHSFGLKAVFPECKTHIASETVNFLEIYFSILNATLFDLY